MKLMRHIPVLAAAVAAVLATGVDASAKTFRYATTGDILGLDPQANNEGPTNTMKSNIYGRLIHRKPDLSLVPDLATSWKRINETTWRFNLRMSNTEPVVRLNVESRADQALMESKRDEILEMMG